MKKAASGILPMIAIDRNRPKPLHRQIYDAYRTAILEGRLHSRQRIPSSRVLASELAVSRFPVLNAYAQLLAEGYIESRVGAGTVVSSSIPDQLTSSRPAGAQFMATRSGPRPVSRRSSMFPRPGSSPWLGGWGAFGVGQVAFDQFPLHLWSSLLARHSRNMDAKSFHYGELKGARTLRPNWGQVDALAWLGQLLKKKGDLQGARNAYNQALALQPDYRFVRDYLLPGLDRAAASKGGK